MYVSISLNSNMSKLFKLRLSLSNFQFCRSNKTPLCLSPRNLKTREISFPTGPPTSPSHDDSFNARAPDIPKKNKVIKTLKSFSSFGSNFSFSSHDFGGEEERETFDSSCDFGVAEEGKADEVVVEEGAVVVKMSEDPYEDFKRSMLEMILQNQIFEVDDLERLLQRFLSLNSPGYHATIVEAFTEIWEVLFCEGK